MMKGFVLARRRRAFAPRRFAPSAPKTSALSLRAVMLAVVLFSGVVLGAAAAVRPAQSSGYYAAFIRQFVAAHQSRPMWQIFCEAFISAIALQCLALFLGLSCLGAPLLLALVLGRGFAVGSLTAYLFHEMGLWGLAMYLLLFFLPTALQCLLLLYLCAQAFDSAAALFRANFLGHTVAAPLRAQLLLRRFLRAGAGALAACCLESILSALFAPVFV